MNYRSPITLAMVKVAREKLYAPDILAHELGHSSLHGDSSLLMPIRTIAPLAGNIANIATGTPYGLAGHLVPLADEAYASTKAMKTLKDWDVSEEDRRAAMKRFGLGFASYAVGPAVDAGLTIGGIAAGSQALTVAAPFAGRLVGSKLSPKLIRKMDKLPIKGISKERATALAAKERPGVDVHFAKQPIPTRGGFISRPVLKPSEEEIKESPLYDEFGAFIGRKASGKLLRKGGVVIGPTE